VGSHCVGLDYLLSEVRRAGITIKVFNVGSMGGLEAARRGESDLSGSHLLDEATGGYNLPSLRPEDPLVLVRGYVRRQGILTKPGRFPDVSLEDLVSWHVAGESIVMVNRNRGSGTRVLTDRLLDAEAQRVGRPLTELTESMSGYEVEARSHNAVAVSIAMNKADWGVGIETVASAYGLEFSFLDDEHYDFFVPRAKLESPVLTKFLEILRSEGAAAKLKELGFQVGSDTGTALEP